MRDMSSLYLGRKSMINLKQFVLAILLTYFAGSWAYVFYSLLIMENYYLWEPNQTTVLFELGLASLCTLIGLWAVANALIGRKW